MAELFNANASGIPYFVIGKSGTTANSIIWGWDSANAVGGLWIWGDSLSTGLAIKAGGKVGIGTNAPTHLLQIASPSSGATVPVQITSPGHTTASRMLSILDVASNADWGLSFGTGAVPELYIGGTDILNYWFWRANWSTAAQLGRYRGLPPRQQHWQHQRRHILCERQWEYCVG